MFRLGLPIGIQTALEFTAFGAVGLMMGRLGTVPVAAHQVAINMASLTFMVPLGMGQAAAVLVGHAIGAADQFSARRSARAAVFYGVGFMAITSIVFLIIPTRSRGSIPPTLRPLRSRRPRCRWLEYSSSSTVPGRHRRHPPGAGTPACPCWINLAASGSAASR
jgi:hypothetical protein